MESRSARKEPRSYRRAFGRATVCQHRARHSKGRTSPCAAPPLAPRRVPHRYDRTGARREKVVCGAGADASAVLHCMYGTGKNLKLDSRSDFSLSL